MNIMVMEILLENTKKFSRNIPAVKYEQNLARYVRRWRVPSVICQRNIVQVIVPI